VIDSELYLVTTSSNTLSKTLGFALYNRLLRICIELVIKILLGSLLLHTPC